MQCPIQENRFLLPHRLFLYVYIKSPNPNKQRRSRNTCPETHELSISKVRIALNLAPLEVFFQCYDHHHSISVKIRLRCSSDFRQRPFSGFGYNTWYRPYFSWGTLPTKWVQGVLKTPRWDPYMCSTIYHLRFLTVHQLAGVLCYECVYIPYYQISTDRDWKKKLEIWNEIHVSDECCGS